MRPASAAAALVDGAGAEMLHLLRGGASVPGDGEEEVGSVG